MKKSVLCLAALVLILIGSACASTAAPIAYVYVQNSASAPIYAFDSSSAGELTSIPGSPFKETTGLMIGSNGTEFITLGSDWVRSYTVSSTGAIGAQVSEINTDLYSDSACGGTSGAQLDPTGQYVYVLRDGGYLNRACSAVQTFQISTAGILTFKGAVNVGDLNLGTLNVTGNGLFAVLNGWGTHEAFDPAFLAQESSGALGAGTGVITQPQPAPGYNYFQWMGMEATDPTNHLAVFENGYDDKTGGYGPLQLASYTASAGGYISTNTWENMPTLDSITGVPMAISPSGTFLAVPTGPGVQFYNFNGAAPITKLAGIVGTSGFISTMAWDTSNHLYALNGSTERLYVYTATAAGATEAAGSPYDNIPVCWCQQTIVVHSNVPVPPPPSLTISANPTSIDSGGSSTLTAIASIAIPITITGTNGTTYTLASGVPQIVHPTATTTYTATTPGAISVSVTVTVTAARHSHHRRQSHFNCRWQFVHFNRDCDRKLPR